jgi:hypothetical protein
MPRWRQAVGPLHVAHVPVFQYGMDPVAGGREYIIELGTPAHLLAQTHGGPEFFLGSQPPAACPGDPGAEIIEGGRALSQINDRLLHGRSRRLTIGLPSLVDATRNVNDEAAGGDPPGGGDRDVDRFGRGIDEPVQFGRGLVAEQSAGPGVEHCRPQPGGARRRPAEQCVHAPVKHLPTLAFQACGDHLGR